MYTDYNNLRSEEHPQVVACKCGRTIHLKDSEVPYLYNDVTCPNCGYSYILICPGKPRKTKGE